VPRGAMMGTALLQDIIVICGLALCVIFVCRRLAIPSIVGFLLTGVVAGPHGLGLVRHVGEVEELAEIGVICLLFTIGLEFSFKGLLQIRFISLVGGSLQVGLTLTASALLAGLAGLPPNQSIFFGFLVTLSSTAIVLKILQERAEIESPHGRLTVGILLFQDTIVVPMMLIAPILAGGRQDVAWALLLLLGKALAVLLVMIVIAKWVVPSVLHLIVRLRGRELFILGIVFIGLSVAWITAEAGLSLALGAFLAGLIISESEFSHRALGNVLPFRDLFTSFFFVSIGMLLDVQFAAAVPGTLAGVAAGIVVLKLLITAGAATLLGMPLRTSVLTGLALAQIGEFSFVLSASGIGLGLIASHTYQLFLGVSVLTMMATPFLIAIGERTAGTVLRLPLPEKLRSGFKPLGDPPGTSGLTNHLVIVGFGLNGRNLSRAAAALTIPRIIIELNPETVRREQDLGEPIFYGDASQEPVLEYAAIRAARVMVIVISDPAATRGIIDTARRLNPSLYIITRTRFVSEMESLHELGADEVIPEDYEASIEVLVRVLDRYLIPRGDIEHLVHEYRSEHYRMLRTLVSPPSTNVGLEVSIPDVEIASLRVCAAAAATGKSLAELDLRGKYGVTVLAIRRESAVMANPSGDETLRTDDICVLMGTSENLAAVTALFGESRPAPVAGSSN